MEKLCQVNWKWWWVTFRSRGTCCVTPWVQGCLWNRDGHGWSVCKSTALTCLHLKPLPAVTILFFFFPSLQSHLLVNLFNPPLFCFWWDLCSNEGEQVRLRRQAEASSLHPTWVYSWESWLRGPERLQSLWPHPAPAAAFCERPWLAGTPPPTPPAAASAASRECSTSPPGQQPKVTDRLHFCIHSHLSIQASVSARQKQSATVPGLCTALPAFSRPPLESSDPSTSCPSGVNSLLMPASPWVHTMQKQKIYFPEMSRWYHPWIMLTNPWREIKASRPALLLQLLLQLCDLRLQSRDGGLELGFNLVLHLLEFGLKLLVLALHLLPGALVLLRSAALRLQLIVQLIHLWNERVKREVQNLSACFDGSWSCCSLTCCALFLSLSLRSSMLPCSSSSSSSSWAILASRRRFSSAKADLRQRRQI